jgi:cell division protein FtsI/penicillin-binding protein 2
MRRPYRQRRIAILLFFFLLTGVALIGRIFMLQIVHGGEYAKAAVIQRSLRHVYATGRGQILDRNGASLRDTRWEPALISFSPVLEDDFYQVLARYELDDENSVHVISNVDAITFRRLQDKPIPGLIPILEEIPYGPDALAPHITGYIQRQETRKRAPNYVELSYKAVAGLERYFDSSLSASRPSTLAVIMDGPGRPIDGLGFREWSESSLRRPYNVVTTIDRNIQSVVEQIGRRTMESGAIVVLDPQNGDILAMASFPDFSPRQLYQGISAQEYSKLDTDPHTPFVNKAVQKYSPGSVFKVVLAAAALENRLDHRETYLCTGSIEVGDRTISCYQGNAHGEVDLKKALTVSCNAYFIQLGQQLGRETVTETAQQFTLGRAAGLPLSNESSGNIPTPEELPFLGDLANASIGQGLVETTPLQLARMMATIANQGRDIYPRLVAEITDKNGGTVRCFPVQYGARVTTPATARLLTSMMQEVVESGTARDAASPYYTAAGKSGTAQTGREGESYYWFAGFAPIEDPLVVAVFLESRRSFSAPAIFCQVMEAIITIK